jgi:hypothetical protein
METRSARLSAAPQRIRASVREACANTTPAIVNIAGNACATGIFVINAVNQHRLIGVATTQLRPPKARCADSESRFLAIKKFSWSPALRLIAARQNRFFCESRGTDSHLGFSQSRGRIVAHDERLVYAAIRAEHDDAASRHAEVRCRAWT